MDQMLRKECPRKPKSLRGLLLFNNNTYVANAAYGVSVHLVSDAKGVDGVVAVRWQGKGGG